MRISAILLAAGLSRRLGRNKLLLPAGGVPVVRRAALALVESRASEVLAVVGHQADDVRAALAGLKLRIVHNPGYAQGQSTSLRAGLAQAAPGAEGFLFALGDQPLLTAAWVDRLIGAFASAPPGTQAAALYHGGQRGNPVLLAASLRGELDRIEGDEGARQILRRLEQETPPRLLAVPAEEEDLFLDLDTEADHARLMQKLSGG